MSVLTESKGSDGCLCLMTHSEVVYWKYVISSFSVDLATSTRRPDSNF